MINHDQNGGGLPAETNQERKKLRKLGKSMPRGRRTRETLLSACRKNRENLQKAIKRVRAEAYVVTGGNYDLLCAAHADPTLKATILAEAKERGLPITAATSLALVIVKLYSDCGLEPATASQQAMALRGAALKGIEPGKLTSHLKHEGIVKLARYFQEKTKPIPSGNDTTIESEGTASDIGKPADDGSDDGNPVDSGPAMAWPDKLIPIWDKAIRKNRRIALVVEPGDGETGTIIEARLLSKPKTEGKHHGS